MRKLLFVLVFVGFVVSLPAHAMLMGFSDGMGLWDENGVQQYTCMPDRTCVGLDDKIYSMPELLGSDISTSLPATSEAPSILPEQPIIKSTTMENSQPVAGEKPQDIKLISADSFVLNVDTDFITILIKTTPDAVVTLTFDDAVVQAEQVEQGEATGGQKHTLFAMNNLTPGTEYTYSLRVETESGWDVKEGTVTTKAE